MRLKLYWTMALPRHYVAEDSDGGRWTIPVDPICPSAWDKREPYAGNYTLKRCPDYIERFYQPSACQAVRP